MPLVASKYILDEIIGEVVKICQNMGNKKISSSIAQYIINAAIIPLVSYRIQGRKESKKYYLKINSLCCKIMKKFIGLPSTYPHKYLQTFFLPIGIRNVKDHHEEQEISNLIFWLNTNSIVGKIITSQLDQLQKCHPIFSEITYQTKNRYINWIWNILKDNQLTCLSTKQILELKKGSFTCQYFTKTHHENQAKTFTKYKITRIENFMLKTTRRQEKILKPFEISHLRRT